MWWPISLTKTSDIIFCRKESTAHYEQVEGKMKTILSSVEANCASTGYIGYVHSLPTAAQLFKIAQYFVYMLVHVIRKIFLTRLEMDTNRYKIYFAVLVRFAHITYFHKFYSILFLFVESKNFYVRLLLIAAACSLT
jgi:hypothetical protein